MKNRRKNILLVVWVRFISSTVYAGDISDGVHSAYYEDGSIKVTST